MSRPFLKLLLPAATGALVLALWYAIHFFLSEDRRFLLPPPDAVLAALRDNAPFLARAALNTSQGALIGFGLAVVVSFALSLLLSLSPLVRASLYPYLMALQLTPLPILAPICVIWAGAGLASVSLLTFAIAFFPLVVNTTQGLISTDRNLVELFRLYGAGQWQQLFILRVPAALPYFFTGLRIAATLAPIGAVVADMNAGSSAGDGGGLGFQAIIYSSQARYPALFATAAVTCVLGFVFNAVVLAVAWLALHHWHDSYERTDK
ncbi:MAG: ABC transporter permease subunit [Verrucomicrobia bacterium]|nr:ABC transporter permease subunit [Verrucomicrobiota bacterium]